MGLTREAVVWAYRILLDREPGGDDEIQPALDACDSTRALRHALVSSPEYQALNADHAQANARTLVIRELEPGLRLVVDLADHAIGVNILRGRFELNEVDFVRRTVRPGQHVIDGGAHVGLFAMHMAAAVGPTGSVHCFEPYEPNASCLEMAIAENRFEHRVVLERAAISARMGVADLACAPGSANTGGAFLAPAGAALPAGHERRRVRTIALDEYPLPRPVAFIKIDIEGAEPQALRGASRLLREDRPVILGEVHPWQLARVSGATPAAFLRQLADSGYRCHLLGAGVLGEAVDEVPANAVTPVVFVPK